MPAHPSTPPDFVTSSISNISAPPAKFSFKVANADGIVSDAFAHFLDYLKKEANIDRERIQRICHRVVHGGNYSDPVIISDESFHHIEKLSDLAPFYAISQTIAKKRGLKNYGFLSSPVRIVLHLGSGASACAIKEGKSLDTSMGLTPLNGLPGATRAGAIDPSLIFHYTNKAGKITHDRKSAVQLHVTEAEHILNTQSGWKALTGTTDFAQVTSKANLSSPDPDYENNPNRLAFDLLVDRIVDYVGGYYLKLNGEVDALVFSGGIGERSKEIRQVIGGKMACLGFEAVDAEKNEKMDALEGVVVDLGAGRPDGEGVVEGKGKKLLVCRTDEQLEMARECALAKKFWE
ncbi:hypothetical protein EYR38_007733 [Pleurotus pulmonarius]|nr:hypothetical protein EYR38_007733 [Pleurotus pulmonarius]